MKMIPILLLALVLAGCGVLPTLPSLSPEPPAPVSDELRTYQRAGFDAENPPIELVRWQISGITQVEGEDVAYLDDDQLARLELYIEAAEANTQALHARTSQCVALDAEAEHLLAAGREAELQAELFRELYVNEQGPGLTTTILATGAAGLIILLLAL